MKKLIISMIALVLLVGGNVNAQNKSPEQSAKAQAEKVKTLLNLSEEQNAKIYQIYLKAAVKTDSIKTANPGLKGKAMTKLTKSVNNARDAKMVKVLTPEQATQYEAKKGELKGGKKGAKKQ